MPLRTSVYTCVFVKHQLARNIFCHPFKQEPPNLDPEVQNTLVKFAVVFGLIEYELQGRMKT